MSDLLYDASALIAGEANRVAMWRLHRRALERQAHIVVPAGVLAQALRDGPQVNLHRMLQGVEIVPLTETHARAIGRMLAAAGGNDVVDGHVVHLALANSMPVVSSDRTDLEHLAQAMGRSVAIIEP